MLCHYLSEDLLDTHPYIKNDFLKNVCNELGQELLDATAAKSWAEWLLAEGCCGLGSFTQSKSYVLSAYKLLWEHEATLLGKLCGVDEAWGNEALSSKATSHTGRAKCFQSPFLIPDHFDACAHALFVLLRLSVELNNKPEHRADPTLKALLLPSPFFSIFEGMLLREKSTEPRPAGSPKEIRYLIKFVNLTLYDLFRIVRIQLFGFWQVLQILPWHPKTQLIFFL